MAELPPGEGPEDDYRRLCNELMRAMLALAPPPSLTASTVEARQCIPDPTLELVFQSSFTKYLEPLAGAAFCFSAGTR